MSDPTDEICNHSSNEHFAQVLARSQQAGLSRRQLIRGGVGLAAVGSLPSPSGGTGSFPVRSHTWGHTWTGRTGTPLLPVVGLWG